MEHSQVQKLIQEIDANLISLTRDNGEEYICTYHEAPEWINDMVQTAHLGMMPNDTSYKMISSVVDCMMDNEQMLSDWEDGDPSDQLVEICDNLVSVYYGDLIAWVSSNRVRVEFVDEACDEMGQRGSLFEQYALGEYWEYRSIAEALHQAIEEQREVAYED